MVTLFNRDKRRADVEKASGGKQTVLYTAKGQPSYMNVVPLMYCQDLGPDLGQGPHPAFIVDGKVHQEFFYGSYGGSIKDGELVSQPGVAPAAMIDFESASAAARSCGQGWHLSSNAERAALMFWCQQQDWIQYGNTDNGRCITDAKIHGERIDHGILDYPEGNPATYTGSGPTHWRHDHTPYGISDLCGNMWEWQAGLRLVDGEIQIIANNDASHADLSVDSAAWRSIRFEDGALLPTGHADSSKFDALQLNMQGNAGTPVLSKQILHRNGPIANNINDPGLMDGLFKDIRTTADIDVPALLKVLGIVPNQQSHNQAQAYLRNYGERMFLAGGAWYSGLGAALDTLCLSHPRTQTSITIGARPAFIV